jgi:hypothetical protein
MPEANYWPSLYSRCGVSYDDAVCKLTNCAEIAQANPLTGCQCTYRVCVQVPRSLRSNRHSTGTERNWAALRGSVLRRSVPGRAERTDMRCGALYPGRPFEGKLGGSRLLGTAIFLPTHKASNYHIRLSRPSSAPRSRKAQPA